MFLRDLLLSSLRRWYLFLCGLMLTVAGGYFVLSVVSPTYETSASVMLLPPDAVVTTGDNPYLYLGGLDQALGVLQVTMNSPEVAKPIERPYDGSKTTYEVSKDLGTTGPIMQIITTGNDPRDVLRLQQDVIDAMAPHLLGLQEQLDVSAHSRITTMVLAMDHKATISHKRQIRALVVVVGGGGSATVLIVGWLDGVLLRRRHRRAELEDVRIGATAESGDKASDAARHAAADVAAEASLATSAGGTVKEADPSPATSGRPADPDVVATHAR